MTQVINFSCHQGCP